MTRPLSELMQEAGIVNSPEEGTPVSESGPIYDPPRHLIHLSEDTRKFLSRLSEEQVISLKALSKMTPEEIETLEDIIIRMNKAKTIGSFGKIVVWAGMGIFGIVVSLSQGVKLLAEMSWWPWR